ncbi:MAG: SUMF1/EgtB/PvdO family nonheme iron enzyme [Bacteroidetes bacterium]|jgi:gliding motility-associated lipoprotein GldJ|nr:SUMF1/EgtB/PvdO family nonheme iron enzyme [Bacteroidota bacterium]
MNFLNSILLFFAMLLISPALFESAEHSNFKTVYTGLSLENKNDPYEGMTRIQGGTFAMGINQEDVIGDWNNRLRRVTVSSFYIDQKEVSNKNYKDYLHWLEKVYIPTNQDSIVYQARPDTLVWRSELSYNEPMVEAYFRHPSFNDYPVVGISWNQANEYCRWRTDRANEKLLTKLGYIDAKNQSNKAVGANNFNKEAYLTDEYNATPTAKIANKKAKKGEDAPRLKINFEDGVMTADYRLPTEAEWEYAAKTTLVSEGSVLEAFKNGNNAKHKNALLTSSDLPFPWSADGNNNLRDTKKGKSQGLYLANFKNSNGDLMGMTGYLNDGSGLPGKVNSYLQNSSLKLYNMAGNVNEWVADVYRPMNTMDMDDFNPFRGNVFQSNDPKLEKGNRRDAKGRLIKVPESDSTLKLHNFDSANSIDALDGDDNNNSSYQSGVNTLISNKSRVYKGGSWKDRPYWLNPGTRRYLDQDKSNNNIGFRCAMSAFYETPAKTGLFNFNFGRKNN